MWQQVCDLLANPQKLEQEHEARDTNAALDRVESLKAQRSKLQHAVERLIDGFTEGLIDKAQFALRMDRNKKRITDLDARIKDDSSDVTRLENLRSAVQRVRDMSTAVGDDLANADWHRRREIVRTLVQRIDIDAEIIKIVFRLNQNARGLADDSIAMTLPRPN